MNYNRKINSVQMLRAFAVLLVVYAHSIDAVMSSGILIRQTSFYHIENWGAIGLDLFFIISGFIMTMIMPAYAHVNGWKAFLKKRSTRIVPLYFLLSFYLIARDTLYGKHVDVKAVLKTITILPVFDTTTFSMPYIAVGWTLAYEVYFYLIITAILFFATDRFYKYLLTFIIAMPLLGLLIQPHHIVLKFVTSPLLIEFALGVTAGLVYKRITESVVPAVAIKTLSISLLLAGLALMLTTIFINIYDIDGMPDIRGNNVLALQRSIIWGMPCCIFLTGVVLLEHAFSFKTPTLLLQIGNASYSCYLIHTSFVIPYTLNLVLLTPLRNGDFVIVLAVVASVFASLLFYKFVEKKLTRYINNKMFPGIRADHLIG